MGVCVIKSGCLFVCLCDKVWVFVCECSTECVCVRNGGGAERESMA